MLSEIEWLQCFKEELEIELKQQNMTQRELADKTGLSYGAISQFVNGKKIPTMRSALKLSYALNLTLDELFDFGQEIE